LIALLSLLVATGVVIYRGWTLAGGTDVPASGYAAMVFGVIISLAVGFGLIPTARDCDSLGIPKSVKL
jgi:hypothetical protein